ncbi:MAG: hypothetical protein RI910_278 [Verrucomicrobiota bacterium]
MLSKVPDYKFSAGLIPDEVDGHTLLRIATAKGDMLVKEGLLSSILKAVVISMHPDDGIADHRPIEIP